MSTTRGADELEFFARIRSALAGGSGVVAARPIAPAIEESLVRKLADAPRATLVARFEERALQNGMRFARTSRASLAVALAAVLRATTSAHRVTTSTGKSAVAGEIAAALESAACAVVDWRASPGLEAHFEVEVGVTEVFSAIAETGTLVVASSASSSRGAWLVPPVHVAIVLASQVVPDLIDGLRQLAALRVQPSAVVFITGPSKTADIEGILVTGVHGPHSVQVLLVEDA
ncbi:MAG: lactate utilization protein C [Planctomycetota bacterium]